MQEYDVPIAFVNGDKLADLALEFDLELRPSLTELLTCLVNREDVEALINTPVCKVVTEIYKIRKINQTERFLCFPTFGCLI